ncbi:MAG TPA: UDP-glucose 4-epimerase GalE, partial [Firmicutes bacterium]|nr:UDP-glucose 4-epimerase GalE [Bacillota bacterium]
MKVLVTGGAGYIGSQVALDLAREGHDPVILDNLGKGHREAVIKGTFIQGEISDFDLVTEVIAREKVEAVIHLAAHSLVGESVKDPAKYFRNNIGNGQALLDALVAGGVKYLVFSSTAAVYGEPEQVPIPEDHPKNPTNPYGFSKLTFEGILQFYEQAYGLRFMSLRYFNAAGADPEAEIGEDHHPESHLIPIVLQTALGARDHLELYGTDYPTPDGTCVRDYIHVADLSQAHLLALKALAAGGNSAIYNLGNGQGYSNKEVIETARRVTGKEIRVLNGPRRPGDPAVLVASSAKIKAELGWNPKYPDLEQIIATAWRWHQSHPQGY